jgi:2-polyprenyl-3-methyl-5-hydroxy-6-metoxy-1,4-benzoquinol methylase
MKCDICNSKKIIKYNKIIIQNNELDLYRCKSCNFIFQKDYKYIDLSYDETYYLREKKISSDFLQQKAEYKFSLIKSYLHNKKKIFEIGSSTGELLEVCKKNNFEVSGLEISKIASQISEQKGIKVLNAGIDSLSEINEKYDAVIMFDVIEHLTDINNFFINLKKILKTGSVIILETPNFNSLLRLLNPCKWVGYNKYHLIYFNPFNLTMLLNKYGFEKVLLKTSVIDVFSINFLKRTLPYSIVSSIAKKIFSKKINSQKTYLPLLNRYNFCSKHLYGDEIFAIFNLSI